MKALAKLKDDARKHEQREEWEKAIDAYVQVVKTAESSGELETELPLFNRIGDLFVRLGRPIDAVTYYEQAADHYAELGLFNNAIALCNKALRYLPSRLELLRKLGQFSAAQGFITDARRWYLEYAERQLKQGALDDAFKALEDFAHVHEDAEIRELLGRYLYAHNRPTEAIAALSRARELRVQAGEMEVANRLAQDILSLDPSANLKVSASAPPAAAPAPVAPPPPPAKPEPIAPPPPAPVVDQHKPSSWLPDEDLPGLAEPVPASAAAAPVEEEDLEFADAPVTAQSAAVAESAAVVESEAAAESKEVFTDSEPESVDALATLDAVRDDSTGGLEAGLIDLDSIPDINLPFDLTTTSLSLGGEVPTLPSTAPPTLDIPFLSTGLEPIETDKQPSVFGDVFSGFSEFSLEGEANKPGVDAQSLLESEVGFEAEVDFTAPPAAEAKPAQRVDDSARFEVEYGTREPVTEEQAAELAPTQQWVVEGLEQEPEPATFSEVETHDTSASAAIDSEVDALIDELEAEQPVEADSSAPPRFSYENVTYPGVDVEDVSEVEYVPTEEPTEEGDIGDLGDALIDPETIEAAEEFFADSPDDSEEVVDLEETLPEAEALAAAPQEAPAEEVFAAAAPAAEPVAEAYVEELQTEEVEEAVYAPEPESESELAAAAEVVETLEREEPAPHREPVPGWVPPTPPGAAEPSPPAAQPALLDGALELARIRQLILAGDSFGAVHQLEALHPKLAESGQMREAWQATEALLTLEPNSLRVLQQRVEYAAASGDQDLTLRSYLDLGRYLDRSGSEAKARVIFQRVLDLDPHNAEAKSFIRAAAPPKVTTGYVDLLALVEDDDEQAGSTRFMVEEKPPTGDEERDFADMLAQFKQKVAENVSVSESSAHYDLGLAFKEMGLIDEAIAEFQVALKGGEERLKVYEELGQCFLLKQQYMVAVTVLNRALSLPVKDDADLLGVYYSLGRSYEALGRGAEARSAYERVVGLDIAFRDASERLARL